MKIELTKKELIEVLARVLSMPVSDIEILPERTAAVERLLDFAKTRDYLNTGDAIGWERNGHCDEHGGNKIRLIRLFREFCVDNGIRYDILQLKGWAEDKNAFMRDTKDL